MFDWSFLMDTQYVSYYNAYVCGYLTMYACILYYVCCELKLCLLYKVCLLYKLCLLYKVSWNTHTYIHMLSIHSWKSLVHTCTKLFREQSMVATYSYNIAM